MFVLYAEKNTLSVREKEPVTSGSVNVYPVQFEFSEDWDRLEKTVIFQAGCVEKAVSLTNGACTVPANVLSEPGYYLMAGVCGRQGGSTVLPTVWANLGMILEGAVPGEEPEAPEPVPPPDGWQEALDSKGDNLSLEGKILSLRSGKKVLSTVELPSGGGEGGPGEPGKDGATFVPSVSEDGLLSWTNDGGLPNPEPVDIKGPSGKDGAPGQKGDPGETGPQGEKGADATINGVNTLELAAGDNIVLDQQGDRLTISSTGGGDTSPAGWDIRSTEEQVVGRWIDGRPLYSRTYLLETKENKTVLAWENLNTPIEHVDKVIDISATLRTSDGFTIVLPYAIYTSAVMVGYHHAPYDSICVACCNAPTASETKFEATFKYTKTTDQATIELPAILTENQPVYNAAPQSAAAEEFSLKIWNKEV